MTNHRARKRFGQHFLVDAGVIDAMLRAIAVGPDDVVVEIGPGLGALTQALSHSAGEFHAVELDRDLAARLADEYRDNRSVCIHQADALQFDFARIGSKLRIVGNLPYNISTPLLFHLLQFKDCIVDMHFMLQKEVVDRMTAAPGSKAYGRLGIMLGCQMHIDALFDVEPRSFDPPPAVRSAVVRLVPLTQSLTVTDAEMFATVVSNAFMKRRKTLRNGLKGLATDADFSAVGIDPQRRPEQLAIAEFVQLSNHLAETLR